MMIYKNICFFKSLSMKTFAIFLLFFSIWPTQPALSQQIKGRVLDGETLEPLSFANIIVISQEATTSPSGTVTDMDGYFTLPTGKESEAVRVSYLGYLGKDTLIIRGEKNLIILKPDAKMLETVVVKGTRNPFKMENGGIAMNVNNSPLKNIGTAGEVLEKLPFVVKNEGTFLVLGKGKPLIYINNRLVRSEAELEHLSSGNIKKVTVITNPGPEYDASVGAVIRIEAVRPPGEGWGGELSGRIKAANMFSCKGSMDLNYRKNKLDLFAYYGYGDSRERSTALLEQTLRTERQTTSISIDNREKHIWREHDMETGLNYEINEKHSLGMKYIYENRPFQRTDLDMTSRVDINGVPDEEFGTTSFMEGDKHSHLLNAYYAGSISRLLKIQLDADYATGLRNIEQQAVSKRKANEEVKTLSEQKYHLYAGKLTLSTPLWKGELKYGAELSRTVNEQGYVVKTNTGAEDLKTNANESRQWLFAAFAGYNVVFGNWSAAAGIRFENVGLDYLQNGHKVDGQSRSYNDFFPNFSLGYRHDALQMMLSYRSTIRRPSYHQLRNSVQYDNPYVYETGNPYQKPARTDDISCLLLWKQFKFNASYKWYNNLMLFVPDQYKDKNIILFSPVNLKHAGNFSTYLYYLPKFGCWEPVAGIGIQKDFLSYGTPVELDYRKPYLHYSLQNTFRLPKGFVFMVDLRGNTKGHSSLACIYDDFQMNAQLNKEFMDGRLVINLRVTDIWGTHREKYLLKVSSVSAMGDRNPDSRAVYFSVRYKFNASKSKYKGKSASEEELNRM